MPIHNVGQRCQFMTQFGQLRAKRFDLTRRGRWMGSTSGMGCVRRLSMLYRRFGSDGVEVFSARRAEMALFQPLKFLGLVQ